MLDRRADIKPKKYNSYELSKSITWSFICFVQSSDIRYDQKVSRETGNYFEI